MRLPPLPPRPLIDRALVEKGGLRQFVRLAYPQVEPGEFVPGWHIDAIAEHLEAVSNLEIRNLIINIPPGCMKSLLASVFWPVWEWIDRASTKFIYASYSGNLSRRDATRARNLINSEWFQARWGFDLDPDSRRPILSSPVHPGGGVCIPWQNTRAAMFYENNKGGFRFSTSIGGEVTGRHGDILIVDDPHKAQVASGGKAATSAELAAGVAFWTDTMSSRQANPQTTRKVIIMQRIAENDLTGAMLETGEYEHLCLPMEFDPRRKCVTSIGWRDPREASGDLLWPERFDRPAVDALKKAMGTVTASAQLDQEPTPAGGAIFKAEHLAATWDTLPSPMKLIQSWDFAFEDGEGSDYVVGQTWGARGGRYYLIDQVRGRWGFVQTVAQVVAFKERWPGVTAVYVEKKANGAAILDTLRREVPGLIGVTPHESKQARAAAVSPLFEAGSVLVPAAAPWLEGWRDEMIKFPRGRNDDQVDATTQALAALAGDPGARFREAMDAIRKTRLR